MSEIEGGCHCGSVKWQCSLPTTTVVKCHCGNCRKLQGSDYSTWVVVPQSQFQVVKGQESISTYNANEVSSKRFCSICGSAVFLVNGKHFPDNFVIPLGSVDNYVEALSPQIQVYTPDKAPWVKLHDDEPIFT